MLQLGMMKKEEVQQHQEQARITMGTEKGEGKQQREERKHQGERRTKGANEALGERGTKGADEASGEGNRWLGMGEEHWG
jgi:hypothetical protein